MQELIAHGVAADGKDAARLALQAGVDMEMVSTNFVTYGRAARLRRAVSQDRIDDAVRRVLRMKLRAGLFENPFVDPRPGGRRTPDRRRPGRGALGGRPLDGAAEERRTDAAAARRRRIDRADRAAGGQPGRAARAVGRQGQPEDVVSVRAGIAAAAPGATINYAPGCTIENPPYPARRSYARAAPGSPTRSPRAEVGRDRGRGRRGRRPERRGRGPLRHHAARPAGEPDQALAATGKPLVLVLMNGRPLALTQWPAGPTRWSRRGSRARGRQRRRRRPVRHGEPRRAPAGDLPVQRRPDADLLRARAHRAGRRARRTRTREVRRRAFEPLYPFGSG